MHPLVMLYRLQGRALYRRMTRNMRSLKGDLAGRIWGGGDRDVAGAFALAGHIQCGGPIRCRCGRWRRVIMLAMSLLALMTSGGEKAVAFTPAEVGFLFPGPFTRRELLAYKIGKALAGDIVFVVADVGGVFAARLGVAAGLGGDVPGDAFHASAIDVRYAGSAIGGGAGIYADAQDRVGG